MKNMPEDHIITDSLIDMIAGDFEALEHFSGILQMLPKNYDELPPGIGEDIGIVLDFFSRNIKERLISALNFEEESIGSTTFERDTVNRKWVGAYREAVKKR